MNNFDKDSEPYVIIKFDENEKKIDGDVKFTDVCSICVTTNTEMKSNFNIYKGVGGNTYRYFSVQTVSDKKIMI